MNSNEVSTIATSQEKVLKTGGARSSCPVCRSLYSEQVFAIHSYASYTIERCQKCGFVHAAPRPEPEELARFYTSEYFRREQETGLGYADYRSLAEINARYMWHNLKSYIQKHPRNAMRLLDVGCATGGFLSEAQSEGWKCLGVELSEYAVDIARGEFGIHVLRGDIFHHDLKCDEFSLITMWHVLEHVIDPVATLKQAYRLLEPGGMLFVELPNWNSLGRRIKGRAWGQLKPPEHINFFTPQTLHSLARQTGFRVIKCTSEYPSLINEAAVRRWSRPFHQGKAGIAALASKLGCGGYARLLAERV